MTLRVRLLPAAELQIIDLDEWWQEHRSAIADHFLDENKPAPGQTTTSGGLP